MADYGWHFGSLLLKHWNVKKMRSSIKQINYIGLLVNGLSDELGLKTYWDGFQTNIKFKDWCNQNLLDQDDAYQLIEALKHKNIGRAKEILKENNYYES